MKSYTYAWQLLDGFRVPVVDSQLPIKYDLMILKKEILEEIIRRIDEALSTIEDVQDVKIPVKISPIFEDVFRISVKDTAIEIDAPVSVISMMTSVGDNLSTVKNALRAVKTHHEVLLRELNARLKAYESAIVGG